jgi:hypothetical protein
MKHLVTGLFFVLISLNASAGYKAAGCGFGALVFQNNNEWWAQTLAATTNGTLGSQTFGITTGSLECDSNALFGQMEKAKVFIEANKNEISNDVARGQGETINALAGIYNCQATEAFAASLQSKYSEIFSENESSDKLALKMQAVALNSCQANI